MADDLLKNGPSSPYRNYFDQSLADETFFSGPIMVPFLGEDLQTVTENGDLKIISENGAYFFNYADQKWPLNPESSSEIIPDTIEQINADKARLSAIAEKQFYRLCSWKETDTAINFRRFFTVNSLICINIQHPGSI